MRFQAGGDRKFPPLFLNSSESFSWKDVRICGHRNFREIRSISKFIGIQSFVYPFNKM